MNCYAVGPEVTSAAGTNGSGGGCLGTLPSRHACQEEVKYKGLHSVYVCVPQSVPLHGREYQGH